ncbi:MAG: hypothetical protein JKY52_00185 [Flavobacteriales bacterium]|nr:hypothetical protein [Flavobacteriales bacterium]
MGTATIEWVDLRANNATVATNVNDTPVDLKSIDFTNSSFEVVATTATSTDSGTPPATATHAVVTSVGSSHYVRITTAPTTSTGGVTIMSGGSRLIAVEGGAAGSVLKICTTS